MLPMFAEPPWVPDIEVVVTSRKIKTLNCDHMPSLSPFFLGPCTTPDGLEFHNMENLWQYSKVYEQHIIRGEGNPKRGLPSPEWFDWREDGASMRVADRYPMGKGAQPLYSWWNGLHFSYVAARKAIYCPEYGKLARKTPDFKRLRKEYQAGAKIVLRDWDAYDVWGTTSDWVSILNDPDRKMGHGFVLAMMLDMSPTFYRGILI